jgi:oxygen-independent coproporphyrinogen-3 oxidase
MTSCADISGVYVHLPFCRKICPFCGFAVTRDDEEKKESYIRYLKRELAMLVERRRFSFSRLSSVYFGGGTPSRYPVGQLKRIVNVIREQVGTSTAQWSIEINPEDITPSYAKSLLDCGFNRVSVGIQSFDDKALSRLGRIHNGRQAHDAVESLQKVGFGNINSDLMFGYPDQTIPDLMKDLEQFIQYSPTHLSIYCLTIEPKTKINRLPAWREWQETNESTISEMYELVVRRLEKERIDQYEVSNFARAGFQSPQNIINWYEKNYLGIGQGAHSHVDGKRWGNERRWGDYKRKIESDHLPLAFEETLSCSEKREERLMIRLRLTHGVNFEKYRHDFGIDLIRDCAEEIRMLKKEHLLKTTRDRIYLTTKGMLLADEIAAVLSKRLPD